MLLFLLNTLPVLGSGAKGNKLISIPSARVKAREEFVVMAAVIPARPVGHPVCRASASSP